MSMHESEYTGGGMLIPDPEAAKPLDQKRSSESEGWESSKYRQSESDDPDYQETASPLDTAQESLEYLVGVLEEDPEKDLDQRLEEVYGQEFSRVKYPSH